MDVEVVSHFRSILLVDFRLVDFVLIDDDDDLLLVASVDWKRFRMLFPQKRTPFRLRRASVRSSGHVADVRVLRQLQ